MTPQELRESIIRLAMKGKLTEQLETDGNSSEMLESIAAYKKAHKVANNKKMRPVDYEDIPFDIPSNWRWTRFGEIVDYRMGKTPPRAESQWWKPDMPWVAIADMPESAHLSSTKEKVSRESLKAIFGNRVTKAGTLLMSFKLTVGRVSILDIDAVHNEAIISIFPYCDDEGIVQSYLFRILPIISQYGDSKNAIKGKTLNDTSICNLLVPFPPLSEQKRIVAKIEELFPLVDRYEQAWTKLEEFNARFPMDMQKSILQMAIQGKLVPQDPSDKCIDLSDYKTKKTEELDFDLPESWVSAHLEMVADSIPSKQYQVLESQVLKEGRFTVISQSKEYSIGYSNDETKLFRHEAPVIVFGDHTTEVKIVEFDFVVGADGVKIFAPKKCLLPKFFYYVMQYLCIDLDKLGGYSRHYKFIKNKPIVIPPLAEQKRIVAKIEELMPYCGMLKK